MAEKRKTINTSVKFKKGDDPILKIMEDHYLSPDIWYAKTIKVTDGMWHASAIKRDQELKWTIEEDKNGNRQQLMTGHGKRYPDFMQKENKTYKIQVVFERFPIEHDILKSYKKLIKDLPQIPVSAKRRANISRNGVAAEITTFDAHLGKLAWEQETGYRNYDLNIAIQDYQYTSDKNLDLIAPHKPEKIFYIVGQDMYHVDNMSGHTTNGSHAMDVDGRITKVHNKAFIVSRDNIYKCSKLAHVEVIWIPGNHDYLASFMLAFALKEHFRNDKRVTVDVGENPRKCRLWGNLLVGWTHRIVGKHTVWSNELAQAFPKQWGDSIFREWHHGDQHKKHQVKITPIFTSGGVVCRQITALSPVDIWHHENVFTDAVPGGESFLWSKEEGVFANFMSWTSQYESFRNKTLSQK